MMELSRHAVTLPCSLIFLPAFVMYRELLCSLAMNMSTGRKALEMKVYRVRQLLPSKHLSLTLLEGAGSFSSL